MTTKTAELSGGNVNYYVVDVPNPKRLEPYSAECEDLIEALGMSFAEGCAFKAIWRSCASRNLGKSKVGDDKFGLYDAQKVVYYGNRMIAAAERKKVIAIVDITPKSPTLGLCSHVFGGIKCRVDLKGLGNAQCDRTIESCISYGNVRNYNGSQK